MNVMNKLGQSIFNTQDRIRTLEAELTQAREDARVLAAEVRAWRNAFDNDTITINGSDWYGATTQTDREWFDKEVTGVVCNTDASGALERNKP